MENVLCDFIAETTLGNSPKNGSLSEKNVFEFRICPVWTCHFDGCQRSPSSSQQISSLLVCCTRFSPGQTSGGPTTQTRIFSRRVSGGPVVCSPDVPSLPRPFLVPPPPGPECLAEDGCQCKSGIPVARLAVSAMFIVGKVLAFSKQKLNGQNTRRTVSGGSK